jgi:hypothetical protein
MAGVLRWVVAAALVVAIISAAASRAGILSGFLSIISVAVTISLPFFREVRRRVRFHLFTDTAHRWGPHPDVSPDFPPMVGLIATVLAYGAAALVFDEPLDALFNFAFMAPPIAALGGVLRNYRDKLPPENREALGGFLAIIGVIACIAFLAIVLWKAGTSVYGYILSNYPETWLSWGALKTVLIALYRLIGVPLALSIFILPYVAPLILGWSLGAPVPAETNQADAKLADASDLEKSGLSRDL